MLVLLLLVLPAAGSDTDTEGLARLLEAMRVHGVAMPTAHEGIAAVLREKRIPYSILNETGALQFFIRNGKLHWESHSPGGTGGVVGPH